MHSFSSSLLKYKALINKNFSKLNAIIIKLIKKSFYSHLALITTIVALSIVILLQKSTENIIGGLVILACLGILILKQKSQQKKLKTAKRELKLADQLVDPLLSALNPSNIAVLTDLKALELGCQQQENRKATHSANIAASSIRLSGLDAEKTARLCKMGSSLYLYDLTHEKATQLKKQLLIIIKKHKLKTTVEINPNITSLSERAKRTTQNAGSFAFGRMDLFALKIPKSHINTRYTIEGTKEAMEVFYEEATNLTVFDAIDVPSQVLIVGDSIILENWLQAECLEALALKTGFVDLYVECKNQNTLVEMQEKFQAKDAGKDSIVWQEITMPQAKALQSSLEIWTSYKKIDANFDIVSVKNSIAAKRALQGKENAVLQFSDSDVLVAKTNTASRYAVLLDEKKQALQINFQADPNKLYA